MSPRQHLLTAALALGLLAGCSRNTSESRPDESGGTSSAQVEAPRNDQAGQAPAERGPAVFFVRDSGVRCMAAPCPAFVATRADRPDEEGLQITDVDFSALNISDEQRATHLEAAIMPPGIKVEATVDTVPNAGPAGAATVLRVTRMVEK